MCFTIIKGLKAGHILLNCHPLEQSMWCCYLVVHKFLQRLLQKMSATWRRFHKRLMSSFYLWRSQKHKKTLLTWQSILRFRDLRNSKAARKHVGKIEPWRRRVSRACSRSKFPDKNHPDVRIRRRIHTERRRICKVWCRKSNFRVGEGEHSVVQKNVLLDKWNTNLLCKYDCKSSNLRLQ